MDDVPKARESTPIFVTFQDKDGSSKLPYYPKDPETSDDDFDMGNALAAIVRSWKS